MTHPIEEESFRILSARLDLSRFGPLSRQVIARVVHATADMSFAESMVVDDDHLGICVEALAAEAPVICDVEMVRSGITYRRPNCYIRDARADGAHLTRSAAAMALAAKEFPAGAVFVIGCAPTALNEVLRLQSHGCVSPAFVVGLPVGFVGAAEAKEALRVSGIPSLSNEGERGGSAAAVAAFNALARMATERVRASGG